MISLAPAPEPEPGGVKPTKFVAPFPIEGEQPAQDAPMPAPAPAPRHAGGGGGGGGARPTGGHLTAQEALAQGSLANAEEQEDQTVRASGDLEARKADALARQAEEQAKAIKVAQEAWQARRDAAAKHLQEREEAAAKTPIRDLFEGRPLANILAAVAAGVGAKAAAITGTENSALRVLDSAAAAYRQKQQMLYEREMSGVANEKDRLQFATMQSAADEAGLLTRFALDRTKKLQEFGADEARLKSDTILATLATKRADRQSEIATGLYKRGQEEVLQAAQAGAARASAAHSMAETRKTDAETQQLLAGNGPGGGGKSGAAEMKMGMMAEKGADALAKRDALISRGVTLTNADRAKIQRNKQSMARAEHMGLAELTAGQTAGLVAQSPYQGLPPAKQELARNNDVLTQAAAVISSPSAAEEELRNVRGLYDLNAPGQSAESGAGTLDTIRGFIGGAKGLGRARTEAAATGAAREKAAAPAQLGKEDIVSLTAQANRRLQANPDDQLARAALERLRRMRQGGGG
jgi:hypothetical protein